MQTLFDQLTPYLAQAAGLVLATFLSAMAAWIGAAVRRRTGLEIEAQLREVLHQALATGAELAVQKQLTGADAVKAAVAHARRSVPDAIAGLSPGPAVLETIAATKIASAEAWQKHMAIGDTLPR